VLAATGLVKEYGAHRALDGFDLTVSAGEIVGLVGRNGAGKTTFVEVVTGLVRPDAGRVEVAGVDALRAPRAARRLLGVAPQEQALYLPATVREHLRLFGALSGMRRTRIAIGDIAEELLLTDVLDRPIGLLSGGQQRRAQAACALLPSPARPAARRTDRRRRSDHAGRPARRRPGTGSAWGGDRLHHPLPARTRRSGGHARGRGRRAGDRAWPAGRPARRSAGRDPRRVPRPGTGGAGRPRPRGRKRVARQQFRPGRDPGRPARHRPPAESVDIDRPGLDDLYRTLAVTSHAA